MIKINAITAEFTATDKATADALMSTKPVRKCMSSVVKSDPNLIVSRKDNTPIQDLVDLTVTIVDRSYTMANSDQAREDVWNVINTWAQKSRVAGVRGERLAVVSDMVQIENIDDNNSFDTFEVNVKMGTAVFYNARRVTVNFPETAKEFSQDLTNLFEHLTQVGAVDCNTGVIVSHELYGDYHTGNTNTDLEDNEPNLSSDEISEELDEIASMVSEISAYDDREETVAQLEELQEMIGVLIQRIENDE